MSENKLETIVKEMGVKPNQSKALLDGFGELFVQAHKLKTISKTIKVSDVGQTEEMQKAHDIRLQLVRVRTNADKARVELKAGYLLGANAVQGIFNDIKKITKPAEEYLLEQEKFAERIQAEKDLRIEAERKTKLSKFTNNVYVSLHPNDLSTAGFDELLQNYKIAFETKKKIDEEIEKKRLAKIEADKEEQNRIRKENAQLKAEAEVREKQLAKERAEQQKKLDIETKAREKLEAEIEKEREAKSKREYQYKLKREADEAEKEAKLKAEAEKLRRAELRPDKNKLHVLSADLEVIKLPSVVSEDAKKILNEVDSKLKDLSIWLHKEIQKL